MLTSPQSDVRLKKAVELLDEIKRTGSHHQINEKIDKYQHDFISPNDPGDEHHDNEAQLAMDEIKIREDAEAAWRDTVLHPDYKSNYDDEE